MAASITLACVSIADEAKQVLDSTAWKWPEIAARDTDVGQFRHVVRQPTRTLEELEMHITTLKPRVGSHAPHTHANEELVIVKEGTLQAHVNGKEIVVGPGIGAVLRVQSAARGAEHRRYAGHLSRDQLEDAGHIGDKKNPPTPAPATAQ